MTLSGSIRSCCARALAIAAGLASFSASAGGGYFLLGYGPYAHQSGGTSAAIGLDGFAGSSNPAKLAFTDNRLDLDILSFMPYRKVERHDSGTPYDFSSKSRNSLFLLPEAGFARKIDDHWSWGVTLYGNGGLNTEYRDDTGVPESNANPDRCGDAPGNFFMGCGKLGFDLAQVIVAPSLSWRFTERQSVGIAPLFAAQRIKVYGFQAFEAISAAPEAVSNRGYDYSTGAGVRVGWMYRALPWLDIGATYASRIHMRKFDRYRGLLADGGNFDVPQNFSVGIAVRPTNRVTLGLDVQRIFFADIPALANGVLNSVEEPAGKPLGSRHGSGFNWEHNTIYRSAIAYTIDSRLTVRAGYAYGRRPAADQSANSVTLGLLAPNPMHQVTVGASYKPVPGHELHLAYGRYLEKTFEGPSATAGFGVGGRESSRPHVDTLMLGWTKSWGR